MSKAMERLLAVLGTALLVQACSRGPDAVFVVSVPWALTGPQVVLDSHTHTRFSDGALKPEVVAAKAIEGGCTALAITDHGDPSERAATPQYFAEVDAVRAAHPSLIVFAGLEWNIPPYLGREHVNVLLDPALEREILPEFKARFEEKSATAEDALGWLERRAGRVENAALIYNHPARLDTDPEENLRDWLNWTSGTRLLVGFEGGPGHQRMGSPGDYRGSLRTKDRWDPVVADVGGTWDRLLDEGRQVWGALAVSDFHNESGDYPPCTFARTHLRVPQKDAQGVLAALRAGSFWAGHGLILNELSMIAVHPAFPAPLAPGEVMQLRRSVPAPVMRVSFKRGSRGEGLPVTVEIIGNGISGRPEVVARAEVGPEQGSFEWAPKALTTGKDGRSAYFRARVLARTYQGETLVAYTNPVRIVLGD